MNGIVLVNKPIGLSSFRIVHQLRKVTQIKRIGHAGTLDPFASGLLIIAIGREFTKQIQHFQNLNKTYLVTAVFGLSTNTYDAYGEITYNEAKAPMISRSKMEMVLPSFLGTQLQYPPVFSAKKQNGKRLYELARKNIPVEVKPSTVTIYDITIESMIPSFLPIFVFKVTCSKGTYIRSLVMDIAQKLNTVAYAKDLVRIQIGPYHLDQAAQFNELTPALILQKRIVIL